jgi:hypothetical protein
MTDQLPAELAALITDEETIAANAAPMVTLDQLVTEFIDLKTNVEELKALTKSVEAKYDDLRKRRLPDKMQELGLISPDGKGGFTHSSGAKVHLRVEVYAYCKKENEPAFFAWLREEGHGDLIKETVHAQTLKAFAKECLKDGVALPAQLTVTPETHAVLKSPKATGEDE